MRCPAIHYGTDGPRTRVFQPYPRRASSVPILGERIDVIVDASEVGTWAYHCHILTHAEGPDGMFGMVTALIVED